MEKTLMIKASSKEYTIYEVKCECPKCDDPTLVRIDEQGTPDWISRCVHVDDVNWERRLGWYISYTVDAKDVEIGSER